MSSQEKDYLTYTGNKVPRVIRFVWTLIVVFTIFYSAYYVWPDLKEWIQRVK